MQKKYSESKREATYKISSLKHKLKPLDTVCLTRNQRSSPFLLKDTPMLRSHTKAMQYQTYRRDDSDDIFLNLEKHRQSLNSSLERAEKMLCTSYNRILENKENFRKMMHAQRKLYKEEKDRWISKNMKLFPSILKNAFDVEERHYYRYKKARDYSIENFYIKEESNLCLNDTFSTARISASMAFAQGNVQTQDLFLSGGINPHLNSKLLLHSFDKVSKQWKETMIDNSGEPRFNISQHCVIHWKGVLFLIGGIAVVSSGEKEGNDRYSIPFIPTFNIKTKQWDRINWGVYLRAHACTILGSHLIIHGGIDQEEHYNQKMYIMDLEEKNCPVLAHIKHEKQMALAYHKIISTEIVDGKIHEELKVKGLICFGGKNQEGKLNKQIYYCTCEGKNLWDVEDLSKWFPLETFGQKPSPRYAHSMNILNTKTSYINRQAFGIVIGGKNEKQQILNDLWLLNLLNLNWTQIQISQNSLRLERGVAYHCTAAELNKIYIIGGYDKDMKCCTGFWSINYEKYTKKGKIKSKKTIESKKTYEEQINE